MNLQEIIDIIVIVLGVLYFIFKIIYKIKVNGLKNTSKDLILKAEELFKTNENDERMDWCISKAISTLPAFIQPYVTNNEVRNIIQGVFDFIKNALEYSPNNDTSVSESENKNEEK